MREIKFRQPIWLNGKFSRFHYWGFVGEGAFHGPLDSRESQQDSQQFTGLHDKNGREIYEGDILDCDGLALQIMVDEYHGYRFMWGLDTLTKANAMYGKVIGNIHEHSELLGRAS